MSQDQLLGGGKTCLNDVNTYIEAVFGAIKKMYGNHLRGRRLVRQNREVAIRIICYNIEVVARSHVKSGRLTHESLTAMAA